jgi:hypothetical protein
VVDQVQKLADQTLPSTISTQFQGAAKAFQSSLGNLWVLLIIAIMVVYIVLGATHPNLVRLHGEAYRMSLERLVRELGNLIREHRTTLVFSNTRSGAEGMTYWLREKFPDLKPIKVQHQFGVSIGGPFIKDKLFFFGSYQGDRFVTANDPAITAVESPEWRAAVIAAAPVTEGMFAGQVTLRDDFDELPSDIADAFGVTSR